MQHIATYLTYRDHLKDVPKYRNAQQQKEAARKAAFKDKKLTPEELNVAIKRGEILKRTVDALDEYSQTKTEDVESITQTVLGESTSILTAMGIGLGKLYQSTDSGKKLVKKLASKMGQLKTAAPNVIPGVTGLLFAIVSSIPLLFSLTTIEIQTPRIARFEALKGELGNPNDFAILTDEQINQAKQIAKNIKVPKPKSTDKSILSSLNVFEQLKSYLDIVTKRAIYKKDKAEFDNRQNKKYNAANPNSFSPKDLSAAEETREITQRLVNKIDIESQDYIENAFKILDVISLCLFGFGVIGYWAVEKALDLLKIKNGTLKKYFPYAAAIAGTILLNSKVAEYRNNAIRISRHKKMNEILQDPTNFLKTPNHNLSIKDVDQPEKPQKQGIFGFIKTFYKDLNEYETYAEKNIPEAKKFKMAVRELKLSEEQMKQARLNQINIFKTINKVDEKKQKYEEKFEVLTMLLSTPMGLLAAAMGNVFGWALHKIKNAPKSHMPLYSIIGTTVGLIPAIAIELYTTIEVRKASRVAYIQAQKELSDKKLYLDYSNVNIEENPFLRMSFKHQSKTFSSFN